MMQSLLTAYLYCCLGVGVTLVKGTSTFIAVKNRTSSCFYDESFLSISLTSACAMNCYLDSKCVSASFISEEGQCLLNKEIQCSTYPAIKQGSMLFRFLGDRSCNTSAGYTFYEELRLCFKFYDKPTIAKNASAICRDDGGRLARITSLEREDSVVLYLAEVVNNTKDILVDGRHSRKLYNGTKRWFWWDDGTWEMNYQNWYLGEPNPKDNWRCIALRAPWSYQWRSVRCYLEYTFLCEMTIGK